MTVSRGARPGWLGLLMGMMRGQYTASKTPASLVPDDWFGQRLLAVQVDDLKGPRGVVWEVAAHHRAGVVYIDPFAQLRNLPVWDSNHHFAFSTTSVMSLLGFHHRKVPRHPRDLEYAPKVRLGMHEGDQDVGFRFSDRIAPSLLRRACSRMRRSCRTFPGYS
jgi:hypothetical protein